MRVWNNDELNLAISMIELGKTYKEIGEELNRTDRSIREKLIKNGYKYIDYIDIYEEIECVECKKKFTDKKINKRKFCSHNCSARLSNKFRAKKVISVEKCKCCSRPLKNKRVVYCTLECERQFKKETIYDKIESGTYEYKSIKQYKDYLIYKYGNKCSRCNWCEINESTGKVPIQLEHKDGNSDNNNLSNLELLCPNCHSLTATYGFLNNGSGRNERRKYRNFVKNMTLDELIEERMKISKKA